MRAQAPSFLAVASVPAGGPPVSGLDLKEALRNAMCAPGQEQPMLGWHIVFDDVIVPERTPLCATPAYEQSHRQRKTVEMLFAHLKRILKLDRLWLRGVSGASDELLMAAAAQNLRRMARWLTPATV